MRVRPACVGDVTAIVDVFAATLALGQPVPFALPGLREYAHLCTGWLVGAELDSAAVLEADGDIVGYALVGEDLRGQAQFQRAAAAGLVRAVAVAAARRELSRSALRFWRLRLRDASVLRRRTGVEPAAVVAHVNLLGTYRAGMAGRSLIDHIDTTVGALGHDRWYGEMNAVAGRRAEALARYGAEVIDREPNHTLSWLAGKPVERLITLRRLDAAVAFAAGGRLRSPAKPAPLPRSGAADRG